MTKAHGSKEGEGDATHCGNSFGGHFHVSGERVRVRASGKRPPSGKWPGYPAPHSPRRHSDRAGKASNATVRRVRRPVRGSESETGAVVLLSPSRGFSSPDER